VGLVTAVGHKTSEKSYSIVKTLHMEESRGQDFLSLGCGLWIFKLRRCGTRSIHVLRTVVFMFASKFKTDFLVLLWCGGGVVLGPIDESFLAQWWDWDPIFLQCFNTVGCLTRTNPSPLWPCVWWDVKPYSTSLLALCFKCINWRVVGSCNAGGVSRGLCEVAMLL